VQIYREWSLISHNKNPLGCTLREEVPVGRFVICYFGQEELVTRKTNSYPKKNQGLEKGAEPGMLETGRHYCIKES